MAAVAVTAAGHARRWSWWWWLPSPKSDKEQLKDDNVFEIGSLHSVIYRPTTQAAATTRLSNGSEIVEIVSVCMPEIIRKGCSST